MKDKIDKIFNTSYKMPDPIDNSDKSKRDYNEAYQRFRELMSLIVDFAEQQEAIKKTRR